MKLGSFKIFILIVFFIVQVSFVHAKETTKDKKGFYFELGPEFAHLFSINNSNGASLNNIGMGLNAQVGWRFSERFALSGLVDGVWYFTKESSSIQTEFNALSLDVAPAMKYFFIKNSELFLTGGFGFSLMSIANPAGSHDEWRPFLFSGLGYDLRIGRKLFLTPEVTLKFYTDKVGSYPFSMGQALQTRVGINIGCYF